MKIELTFLSVFIFCGCSFGETHLDHLIPIGYVGPVVVVWGDTTGDPIVPNEDGNYVLKIPQSGTLRVKNPRPVPEIHYHAYFYIGEEGGRSEIPIRGDPKTLQVFGSIGGGYTNVKEGKKEVLYKAYVVGVPQEMGNWFELREGAIDRAIGRGI